MNIKLLYLSPFIISVLSMIWLSFKTYTYRHIRGGKYLFYFSLAAGYWALMEGSLYMELGYTASYALTLLSYPAIVSVPVILMLFYFNVLDFPGWDDRKRVRWFFIVPLFIVGMVWTNPLHHLFYTDVYTIRTAKMEMIGVDHGPVFWINAVYYYIIMGVTFFVLLFQMVNSKGFRRDQARMMLVIMLLLWTFNIIYVTGNSPVPNMDITPIGFSLTAVFLALGFFRYNLLDLLPVAKSKVFDDLSDPIIVLDTLNRIVAVNPAGISLIEEAPEVLLGKNIRTVFASWPGEEDRKISEFSHRKNGLEIIFELHRTSLRDMKNDKAGQMAVLQDITARKMVEREREQLLADLQHSMHEIKTLSGLLPICANCKNVRDDSGYWHQIENYISEHSEADFSHGLCPSCAEKLYPELFVNKKK